MKRDCTCYGSKPRKKIRNINPSDFIASILSTRKQGYWRGTSPILLMEHILRSPVGGDVACPVFHQGLMDLRWCRIYSMNSITTSFYLPQPYLTPACQHPPHTQPQHPPLLVVFSKRGGYFPLKDVFFSMYNVTSMKWRCRFFHVYIYIILYNVTNMKWRCISYKKMGHFPAI